MDKLRAAVIGCGRIGFSFDADPKRTYVASHTMAYHSSAETELVAVSDLDPDKIRKCQERISQVHGYTDFKEMLAKEKIDIVSICTLPRTHLPILEEVVKYPVKAIFCEKPIAQNTRSAEKMLRLCAKRKILLQIDHQRRFDALHLEIRQAIQSGRFGSVQQCNFYYTAGIYNSGSHMFDLLRFFFGEVKWVEGVFSKNISHKEDDPNIDGILTFESGVMATFQSCDVKQYLIFELNCLLEQGRIVLKNSGFCVDLYAVADSRFFSGYKELTFAPGSFNQDYQRQFMSQAVAHLLECLKDKKVSISSGRDGLMSLKCIEASCASAKDNGKRIYLD